MLQLLINDIQCIFSGKSMRAREPYFNEIAAVDLGSNSFRLQMARVVDDQLVFHDSLRDMVRLGAGLGPDRMLDADALNRATDCLRRFGQRLRGLDPHAVRAVATNTFRVARNAPQLLEAAQAALGFPIEIIAGREEARMIFVGVSHGLPFTDKKRMVMDIGGGSTEFIIGQGLEPQEMDSLYMGCVSYSMKFFGDGRITEEGLARAEISARTEIQTIRRRYFSGVWHEAVGSSGTARALGEILRLNGWGDGSISREGLQKLRAALLKCGEIRKLQLAGLSEERAPSFPGGFAIMSAAFDELGIEKMTVAGGALREGVLYELLGRMHHHDTREATVARFKRRYHVDAQQAKRVQMLALQLLAQVQHKFTMEPAVVEQYLTWAARLHEIGISIAHSGYQKHSAYILENADMPGFSRMEQQMLGMLVRCQRRSLTKAGLPPVADDRCAMVMVLRLSVLMHRNRQDIALPPLKLGWHRNGFSLKLDAGWLAENQLTEAALKAEISYWKDAGISLVLE
jgi:exopolyphosphatase / guanosine-5'-triphosphate,3'-diphosphate pyrophosphatase